MISWVLPRDDGASIGQRSGGGGGGGGLGARRPLGLQTERTVTAGLRALSDSKAPARGGTELPGCKTPKSAGGLRPLAGACWLLRWCLGCPGGGPARLLPGDGPSYVLRSCCARGNGEGAKQGLPRRSTEHQVEVMGE